MTTADLDSLRAQLRAHEGVRLMPYRCPAGKLTIGVGRNLDDRGISTRTAEQMLDEDIDACLTDLQAYPWFGSLDAIRQRALVDLRFNLGSAGFRQFKKMIGALQRHDYAEAANQLASSAWAGQVQPARRDRLLTQLRDGRDA